MLIRLSGFGSSMLWMRSRAYFETVISSGNKRDVVVLVIAQLFWRAAELLGEFGVVIVLVVCYGGKDPQRTQ